MANYRHNRLREDGSEERLTTVSTMRVAFQDPEVGAGFLFVRRNVSSPEIVSIKLWRMVAVPRYLSIAQSAVHRHPKAHTDPLCPA